MAYPLIHHQILLPGPARVYATLNPSDKSANLTLSASSSGTANCRATRGGSTSYEMVRATQAIGATDLVYFEGNCSIASGSDGCIIGMTTSGATLNSNAPGLTTPSFGMVMTDATDLAYYLSTVSTHSGYLKNPTGGYGHFAINNAAGKGWLRNSSASYPGWAGGGDPAAGTSPTFTFTAGQSWYPALSLYTNSQIADMNFGATAFNGTAPSGFRAGIYT